MAKSLPLLSGRDVTKVFADKRKRVVAVDHVNFDFNSSEIISIVGESGSGKTTLAKMILGLTVPTDGKIFFKENLIDLRTKKKRIEYWRNVQPIFQDPFSSFNIFRKVNNVLLDCMKLIDVKLNKGEERKLIEEALSFVNLRFDEIYNKYPFELSGGQMQRLMIARVLLIKPSLVIADEPTSMIDACSRASILDALMKLKDEIGTTVVFITHDIGLAYYVSDKIYVMKEGRFVEEGLPDDVILNPKEDYTKHLIGDVPKIESKWAI
ncbi:ABC transporter ATP-binding protein [Thermoanaerobacterium sp. R66]|jgi:peptide/nickel transport system ATP-binding protein|uniref:ABC transporter ATP-binding protein n=1 Tax=Thermoanaerobacterium sp. R66 TaxID=2742479 RepID=UPI0023805349|nr:ABC transporter ATP-binding protein [Thermoanaerobacterium sp. R66]MDE4541973.1 ABC transporter ATP-binding protein [Thermoanaerobacterium sp. R66]